MTQEVDRLLQFVLLEDLGLLLDVPLEEVFLVICESTPARESAATRLTGDLDD